MKHFDLSSSVQYFVLIAVIFLAGAGFYLRSLQHQKDKAMSQSSKKSLEPRAMAMILFSVCAFLLLCYVIYFFATK